MELDFWFDIETINIQKCEKHGEYEDSGFGCPACEYEVENSKPYFEGAENEEA